MNLSLVETALSKCRTITIQSNVYFNVLFSNCGVESGILYQTTRSELKIRYLNEIHQFQPDSSVCEKSLTKLG